MDAETLDVVRQALSRNLTSQQYLGLYPEPEQIERLASSMPDASFDKVCVE